MGECDPIKIEEYNNFSDPQTKYLVYRVWMRPLVLLMDRGGWVFFTPYRLYHKPPLRGGIFLGCCFAPRKLGICRASVIHGREACGEGGGSCAMRHL